MIDHLMRDLQVLRKADFLIGKIWLDVLLRRSGLLAFAALISVFALAMANVAGFLALQQSLAAVWAATIVAAADLAIAAIVLLIASRSQPGPELELALEVRRMAIDSLQADAREVKVALEAIGQEVKGVKASIVQLVHNPLDVAAQKLLVPAALSLLKGLRARKEHA